jgi:hypothetical protein
MASTESLCDYPGCGTKLKPLFSSLYCPNEEEHGKTSKAKTAAAITSYYAAAGYPSFAAFLPACTHHSTVTMNGVTKCLTCGEELTTPYP